MKVTSKSISRFTPFELTLRFDNEHEARLMHDAMVDDMKSKIQGSATRVMYNGIVRELMIRLDTHA